MMNQAVCRPLAVATILLALTAPALAGTPLRGQAEPDWYYLHPDSLLAPSRHPEPIELPSNKLFYLEHRHGLCPSQRRQDEPESLNVRMVGKWGGGPSWGVTGRDSLVYLSRGSEVVVVNFADPAGPAILNHIQARRLAGRPVLQDSLLYLATSGYIEVFNVKDPVNAFPVGRLGTAVNDIAVADTLVYAIARDSFKIYSFANPQAPYLVGACRDSGYALDVDRGYAYLRDRWGMYILDATDPANPRRVASWGTDIAGVKVRGNHCYVAQGQMGSNSLHVLNVSDPVNPWEQGRLTGLMGEDICLVDTLLFMPGFDVVNVADPSRPTVVGSTPAGSDGVWAIPALGIAVTAGREYGMHVLDISDIAHPVLDTSMLAAYSAVDISVRNGLACVATQYTNGVLMLDIGDPANPWEIGRYDSAEASRAEAVVLTDSLLYIGGFLTSTPVPREIFHVVDIRDPADPLKIGRGMGTNPVPAMVLRDSLLYCAEDYRFEVFNVADPRQPVWMGGCNAYSSALGIDTQDTLVYVAPRLQIFNIADPANPTRIYETSGNRVSGRGIAARDTFLYFLSNYDTLWVYNAANPYAPRIIGFLPSGSHRGFDLVLRDSYAYAGCLSFRLYDIASPAEPVAIGHYETPYHAMSLDLDGTYVYVASFLAGVLILEVLPMGLAEFPVGVQQPARLGLEL
ncbi:MAG: hypothetical protein R6X14_00570, partial [bacterium]